MNRPGWIVLVATILFALPLAADETVDQCTLNCLPGVNACSNCCYAQFDAAKGPCYAACNSQQSSCFDAAWRSCQSSPNPQNCYARASSPCVIANFECQRNCDQTVRIAGGCPGEKPPQKCPYNCQVWNPASQTCIGPQMNVCANMKMQALADTTSHDDAIVAARAKAAADAAAKHAKTLQANTKPKTKDKKK